MRRLRWWLANGAAAVCLTAAASIGILWLLGEPGSVPRLAREWASTDRRLIIWMTPEPQALWCGFHDFDPSQDNGLKPWASYLFLYLTPEDVDRVDVGS